MSTVPTWAAMRAALPEGTDGEIVETVRRATIPVRREARIHAAWEAACRYVDHQHHAFWGSDGATRAAAIALCWLEVRGLYGGGAGARRHPAFEGLGSGSHQAPDGGAWDDAIACAAHRHVGPAGVDWADLGGLLALRVDIGHPEPQLVALDVLLDDAEALKVACLHCVRDLAESQTRGDLDQITASLARTLAIACARLREREQEVAK
jgi:hypothetical protein